MRAAALQRQIEPRPARRWPARAPPPPRSELPPCPLLRAAARRHDSARPINSSCPARGWPVRRAASVGSVMPASRIACRGPAPACCCVTGARPAMPRAAAAACRLEDSPMTDAPSQLPAPHRAAGRRGRRRGRPRWSAARSARWSRALRDIAAGALLPFGGGDDRDLPPEQAERLRAQMRECLAAHGGEVLARAQAASIASVYLGLSRHRAGALLRAAGAGLRRRARAGRGRDRAPAGGGRGARQGSRAERALRRALITPGMRLLTKFIALPEGHEVPGQHARRPARPDRRRSASSGRSTTTSAICSRPGATSAS